MVSRHPSVTIISNLDANGKPVMDNGGLGSYEVVWHTDNSYVKVPPAGSMLYSLEVPMDGGGDTSFNNQYLAYEELPDDLKRAIEGKSQVHDSSRNSAGVLRPGVKLPTKPEEVEGPTHPLVRVHPVTGKRALYLGRRRVWPSNYIVGMPERGKRAAARPAVGARDAAQVRVDPQVEGRRYRAVGQPLLHALPHRNRRRAAAGDAPHDDQGRGAGRAVGVN